jgi:uncharacterized protein (TIGR03089 family)
VGLAPGDRVAVLLPAHWQTAAVLLGGWAAGGVLTTDPAGAAVAFADADRAATAAAAGEVFALSLSPLGREFAGGPPPGARDFAAEVRAHGDRFTAARGTGADLVDAARRRAAELGLRERDRLLITLPWNGPGDWVDGLLAPLAARATLVLCANPDPAALPRRAEAEHVTATVGVSLGGIRRL